MSVAGIMVWAFIVAFGVMVLLAVDLLRHSGGDLLGLERRVAAAFGRIVAADKAWHNAHDGGHCPEGRRGCPACPAQRAELDSSYAELRTLPFTIRVIVAVMDVVSWLVHGKRLRC